MHAPPALPMPQLPTTHEAAEALMDAAAPFVGLTIPAACREGVIASLQAAAGMAALVLAEPTDPTDEPAPVFRP
jgi:hypothetical protein